MIIKTFEVQEGHRPGKKTERGGGELISTLAREILEHRTIYIRRTDVSQS